MDKDASTQTRQKTVKISSVTPTGSSEPVSRALPAAVERIVHELHPHKVVLFGSYAYGAPTPDSDVDLLVIMDTTAPATQRYLAVSRLLRPRPFPVDILVKTPQEIDQALAQGDFFLREILSQGKVLYERSN